MKKIAFLLVLYYCIPVQEIYSQDFPDFKFRYLTMKEGLSDDYVTCFTQDKNGFIWMGTSNGLNRYDGNRFKQFFHDPQNNNSIPNNVILELVTDDNNRIWITTEQGVCCYNQITDVFTNYSKIADGNKLPMSRGENHLSIDKKKQVWISSHSGFYTVDNKYNLQKQTIPVWKEPGFTDSIKDIRRLYRDKQDDEWIFTDKNLYLLNKETKQPVQAFHLPSSRTTGIYQDSEKRYWVSTTDKGLFIFNRSTGSFSNYLLPTGETCIYYFHEWKNERGSWLIVPGFSLVLINTKTLQAKAFEANIYNKRGYQGTYWANIFIDKDNRLWMGYERGINVLQLHLQKTEIIPLTSPGDIPYQEPEYGVANILYSDSSGYWVNKWWGKRGTYHYDKSWNLIDYYRSFYPLSKILINNNTAIYDIKTKVAIIYLTTIDGLILFNRKTKISKLIKSPVGKETPLESIIEISSDTFWIQSDSGIYVFDIKNVKFIKKYTVGEIFGNNSYHLMGIIKKKDGRIFCSAHEAVMAEFIPGKNGFNYFSPFSNNPSYNLFLNKMAEDRNGDLWVSTYAGVFILNPETKKIIKTFAENKLIGSVSNILIDAKQNVWCNTRSSIWCFVQKKQKWVSLNSLDGLPAEVCGFNALIELPDGSILTTLGEKAIRFYPDFWEQENHASVPVFITEVSISGKEVHFIENSKKEIEINPGENSFSVDFAVLNYDQPNGIKYYYKLEPSMKEFQENKNNHLIFNDLSPGNYILKVKGADKLGNFSINEDILLIYIKPYWHQSLAFKIICLLALAIAVYLFIRWRIKSVKAAAALQQQITETEIAALKAQMNPHFIFNCINSIDAFIHSNDKYNATLYLNKFAKLLRNILDSSKQNTVAFTKDVETLKLYVELEELRHENKFKTIINIEEELLSNDYKVPPLVIQPFVENAILHGLKNREDNAGLLQIEIKKVAGKIEYTIKDNGIGRKAAAMIAQNKEASYGMQMSNDRVKLFNKEEIPSVQINDLYFDEKATGTEVKVRLNII